MASFIDFSDEEGATSGETTDNKEVEGVPTGDPLLPFFLLV